MKLVKNNKTGFYNLIEGNVNFGIIDDMDLGRFAYFPYRQDALTGNQYIEIGRILNGLNGVKDD